jgi:drug/metabolite transporter (DMT)-like permease
LFNTVLFGAIAGAQIWVVAVYLLSAEGLRRPYFGRPARYDNFGPGIAIVLLSAVTYSFYTARARAKSRASSAAMLGIGDDGLITAASGQLVAADDTVGARLLSDADVAAIFSARAPLSPLSPLQLKPGRSYSFSLGHMAGHGARSVSAAVDVVRPSSVMHSGAAVFARET